MIHNIDSIVVGITTRCNAKCTFCAKTQGMRFDEGIVDLDLNLILSPLLSRIEQITMVGALGDPMLHPDLLRFLKDSRSQYPDMAFKISTNGSMNTKEFWSELGSLGNIDVIFCLDGLSDTHHIHRSVSFDKVIDNLKTYIKYNGNAIWQFIVFDYNYHQIEEAAELAKSLGCKEFNAIRSIAYDSEFKPPDGIVSTGEILSNLKGGNITCTWYEKSDVFINEYGEVHPCCHIAPYLGYDKYDDIRSIYLDNKDEISLYNHNIDTIMNNTYLQYVYQNKELIQCCSEICTVSTSLWPYIDRIKHCVF